MKLSVLIPAYDEDCTKLISELCQQGGEDIEIIIGDDAGPCEQLYARLAQRFVQVRHLRHEVNQGRARNRNILLSQANHDHRLIIDADALPMSTTFLAELWEQRNDADVLCARIHTANEGCQPGHELRYRYEVSSTPKRTAAYRERHPYEMLSTFCILMHRRATQDEAFDESITQYGYEDTLFGLRLKERGLTIKHTDTPCLHTGIDTSEQFLRKTQTALSTLRSLGPVGPRISGIARLSQRLGPLRPLVACAAKPLIPLLRRHLLSAHPTVCAFQAYKLLYFLSISSHTSSAK